jgi:hypothetical protein
VDTTGKAKEPERFTLGTSVLMMYRESTTTDD